MRSQPVKRDARKNRRLQAGHRPQKRTHDLRRSARFFHPQRQPVREFKVANYGSTKTTSPRRTVEIRSRSFGMRGKRSAKRFELAIKQMTAIEYFEKCC